MVDALIRAFFRIPFAITRDQAQLLSRYHHLLSDANRHMNLTAITDANQAINLHYVDSAAPLFLGWIPKNSRCVDVGTGAGLPGIVLAILRPDCTFVLMDAQDKRIRFILSAIDQLSLDNVAAVHIRAEEAGQSASYREAFDIALSRAVAPLPVLCEYCLPLTAIGGSMIAYKGPDVAADLNAARPALQLLGADTVEVADAPTPHRNHTLARIHKSKPTPAAYPRRAGIPAKRPLA